MIAKHDIVSVSPHQVSTNLGSESIVLELQAGTYFGVNDVGSAIWSVLQQRCRVTEVIAHIVNNYEVSAGRAEAEILSFLQQLVDKGLVVVEPGNTRLAP